MNEKLICPTCGQPIGSSYLDEQSMQENNECWECSFWRKRLSLVGNPNIVIIDGTFYTIDDENSKSEFRGFGGAKFQIEFNDGRKVITTNLWCGGDIPTFWQSKFPNNARFENNLKWVEIGNSKHLVKV